MNIINIFKMLISQFLNISLIKCNTPQILDLHKIIKADLNHLQFYLFISDNLTKITDPKLSSLQEFPNTLYSFKTDSKDLYDESSNKVLRNIYSLKESLVIFYTSNLNEINIFIDFLITLLSTRERPKCLIIYSSNNSKFNNDTEVMIILQYAWSKKFLDFTVIKITMPKEEIDDFHSNFIYNLNPFNNIVYKKELDESSKIFPDKLRDGYQYPLHYAQFPYFKTSVSRMRKHNKKEKIIVNFFFAFKFAADTLNFKLEPKHIEIKTKYLGDAFFSTWNMDIHQLPMFHTNHTKYLMPFEYNEEFYDIVALVPIILNFQVNIYFKIIKNFLIISGIILSFLYMFGYLQKASVGRKTIFDSLRLLLGQSIAKNPEKTSLRIVMLTVITASILIMNDLLSDIISIQFEKKEMPFESYEDLYNSQLQTYTNYKFLETLPKTDDPFYSKIINKTLVTQNISSCLHTLKQWKNVSCIFIPDNPEYIISEFRDPDGKPTMKVAKPLIFSAENGATFWFPDGSPYPTEFLKIMRRIAETSLMRIPSLLYKKQNIFDIADIEVTSEDGIRYKQLLTILSFGFSFSIMVFVTELITFKIRPRMCNLQFLKRYPL